MHQVRKNKTLFPTDHSRKKAIIVLLLTIGTLITYWQVFSFGFLDYDTQVYVTSNRVVLSGSKQELE
jgi:hypothetical protein